MAKEGIGYFSLDTDFFHSDKKVKIIKGEFGAKGVIILLYTLCAIYSDKGYYMEWENDDCYLMSDDLGCDCSPNLIGEVINRCVKRGIFNEEVFNAFGVLTSHGIQIRFLKAAAKREKIKIIEEYALFDFEELKEGMRNKIAFFSINVARKSEKAAREEEKAASCDAKKESKGKESKVKESKDTAPQAYYPNDEKLNQAFADYVQMRKLIKKPMTDKAVSLAMSKLQKLAVLPFSERMDNDLAIQILEQSVMNSWQGLFPLKEIGKGEKKKGDTNILDEWRNA